MMNEREERGERRENISHYENMVEECGVDHFASAIEEESSESYRTKNITNRY
jgi:hypothetical protein